VPLDDDYSFDGEADDLKTSKSLNPKISKPQNPKTSKSLNPKTPKPQKSNDIEATIALVIKGIKENPRITQKQMIENTGKSSV
jgi:hypothetical protein